jgi:hypothetical protein
MQFRRAGGARFLSSSPMSRSGRERPAVHAVLSAQYRDQVAKVYRKPLGREDGGDDRHPRLVKKVYFPNEFATDETESAILFQARQRSTSLNE